MTNTEHTPGPWTACASGTIYADGPTNANGRPGYTLTVARVLDTEPPTFDANARLIAAAPELLDACADCAIVAKLWAEAANTQYLKNEGMDISDTAGLLSHMACLAGELTELINKVTGQKA